MPKNIDKLVESFANARDNYYDRVSKMAERPIFTPSVPRSIRRALNDFWTTPITPKDTFDDMMDDFRKLRKRVEKVLKAETFTVDINYDSRKDNISYYFDGADEDGEIFNIEVKANDGTREEKKHVLIPKAFDTSRMSHTSDPVERKAIFTFPKTKATATEPVHEETPDEDKGGTEEDAAKE